MKFTGIIPARYESSRFPGKPLVMIGEKSMIQRVYEQATSCKKLHETVVATDDERILNHVLAFGGRAELTSKKHKSGTDRCAELIDKYADTDVFINIQGDEPFIDPEQITLLCNSFNDPLVEISTLMKEIKEQRELFDINRPKVVVNKNGFALYFSRQCIPYIRSEDPKNWFQNHVFYKHVGIYAYRKEILNKIVQLPTSKLEENEQLEQLRWLENGYNIKTQITDKESFCVDTPEDLTRIINLYIR